MNKKHTSAFIPVTQKNRNQALSHLYPLSRLYADASLRLGYRVEVHEEPSVNIVRVYKRRKLVSVTGAHIPHNTQVGVAFGRSKHLTGALLQEAGVPSPKSVLFSKKRYEGARKKLDHLQFPVVVKPNSGTIKGNGVITNIKKSNVHKFISQGLHKYPTILVEEYYAGLEDYRLLVLDGKVIASLHRIKPFVVGDGQQTIRDLIAEKNVVRASVETHDLGPIKIDEELRRTVKSQRFTMKSVLKKGRTLTLKQVCNFGAGGETRDVTNLVHPDNAAVAVAATKALGLRCAGVDLLATDITKSIHKTRGVIIELNHNPDIAMHHFPVYGEPKDVAYKIMKVAF